MKDTVTMAAGYPTSSQKAEANADVEADADAKGVEHVGRADRVDNSKSAILESGFNNGDIDSDFSFLSAKEYSKIMGDLKDLLIAICDFSHDECAKLLTTLAKSKSAKDKPSKSNDKLASNGSPSILDNVSAKQIYCLSKIIEFFSSECEKISSKSPTSLKSAFQLQANKFVNKFHNERKDKLSLILENECWRPAEVKSVYQSFVDDLASTGKISWPSLEPLEKGRCEPVLMVNEEKYIVVG